MSIQTVPLRFGQCGLDRDPVTRIPFLRLFFDDLSTPIEETPNSKGGTNASFTTWEFLTDDESAPNSTRTQFLARLSLTRLPATPAELAAFDLDALLGHDFVMTIDGDRLLDICIRKPLDRLSEFHRKSTRAESWVRAERGF
jgi:hypothetical protein